MMYVIASLGLFNKVFSCCKITSLISEEFNGKGVEGSVHGLIYLEGFRNTKWDLNEVTWSVVWDSSLELPKYTARLLTTRPWYSVGVNK
jgi:hypothetical protein